MKKLTSVLLSLIFTQLTFAQCSVDLGVDTVYVCQGDSIQFDAGGSWTTYLWSTGETSSSIFAQGSDIVSVEVTDGVGCTAYDTVLVIGVIPEVIATESIVCTDDPVSLTGQLYVEYDTLGSLADTLQLPDGAGVNYETSVSVSDFAPGATVEDVFDVLRLCVTMEHSYLGDLEVKLTCPSGDSINVFDAYVGNPGVGLFDGGFQGGDIFLGNPIDTDLLDFGDGWSYCFSDIASWGTFAEERQQENFIMLDTLPGAFEEGFSMAPGVYKPAWPMENLMGCPLNGDWTITIRDNLSIDDGFIMFWGIEATSEIEGVSYMWSTAETTQEIQVAPPTDQSYSAGMTIGNATCTDSTLINVSNNPPTFTVTETPMSCDSVGGSVNITYTGGLAVESQWDPSDLINLDLGIHEFTLTDTAGCDYSVEAEIVYEENPWPSVAINLEDATCNFADGVAQVVATGSYGPYTLEWFGENPEALYSGSYPVTIIDGNTCEFDTSVTVETDFGNIENIVGTTMTFPGQEFTYSVPFSECLSYNWTISEGTIISGQGTNMVTVTWANSVSGWIAVSIEETRDFSTELILYVGTSTGIDSPEVGLELVPNPSNGLVALSAHLPIERIDVIDFAGRTLITEYPNSAQFTVNLEGLEPGCYVLRALGEGSEATHLVVKE